MKDIADNSIDCIITDIPYNISKENHIKTMKDRQGRNGIDFGQWDYGFDVNRLNIFPQKLKQNGSIVIFHSFEQFNEIKNIFENHKMSLRSKFVWQKTNPLPLNRDRKYISDIELCSWYTFNDWTFNRQNTSYQSSVFRYPSESGANFKRYHPTQKNLDLMTEIVKIHTNENDKVLDPFMGSGTTGVACVNTNRSFIGIEKDSKYFEIAKSRISKATCIQEKLEGYKEEW